MPVQAPAVAHLGIVRWPALRGAAQRTTVRRGALRCSFPLPIPPLSFARCMVALAVPRFAMLLAAACGIVGCASGPELPRAVTVTEGQRTVVALEQVGSKLLLTLQNDSAGRPAEVYSGAAADGRKVVADAQLQALLDVFAANGMFEKSLGAVPPDARDVLTVVQGERRWIWARRQIGMQAAEQSFHEARAYFLQLYNSAIAYHGPGEERPNFKDEKTRAASEAEAAKQKLESARRKP